MIAQYQIFLANIGKSSKRSHIIPNFLFRFQNLIGVKVFFVNLKTLVKTIPSIFTIKLKSPNSKSQLLTIDNLIHLLVNFYFTNNTGILQAIKQIIQHEAK